jgi:uridine kinase
MKRSVMIEKITEVLIAYKKPHPLRIAIDGVDGAGKSILADELTRSLKNAGKKVIRASIDGFHRSENERYARGVDSPQGYFHDSFDYDAIKRSILIPLGEGGSLQYCTTVFDYRKDSPVQGNIQTADKNSILVFDGVFLLRPALIEFWDYKIFVKVSFKTVLQRVETRDQELFGSQEAVRERYLKRYIPGQKIYLRKIDPEKIADMVIINDDPLNPAILL